MGGQPLLDGGSATHIFYFINILIKIKNKNNVGLFWKT
jgi:hypothetical protein